MNDAKAVPLRYRFHTPSQLRCHLRPAEGRALFFYRKPAVELRSGQRVSLEVTFDSTELRVLLHGSVLSAIAGVAPGVWLKFADTGVTRATLEGSGFVPRQQRRLGCEAMVQVEQGDTRAVGKMVDVSLGGARIDSIGELRRELPVKLRVLLPDPAWPREIGLAHLVRRDEEGGVGLRFVRSDPRTRVASMMLFNAVQAKWSLAAEREHPVVCCRNGVQLDPSPPALKALFTRHEVH
jgi:hypothetical protein